MLFFLLLLLLLPLWLRHSIIVIYIFAVTIIAVDNVAEAILAMVQDCYCAIAVQNLFLSQH